MNRRSMLFGGVAGMVAGWLGIAKRPDPHTTWTIPSEWVRPVVPVVDPCGLLAYAVDMFGQERRYRPSLYWCPRCGVFEVVSVEFDERVYFPYPEGRRFRSFTETIVAFRDGSPPETWDEVEATGYCMFLVAASGAKSARREMMPYPTIDSEGRILRPHIDILGNYYQLFGSKNS